MNLLVPLPIMVARAVTGNVALSVAGNAYRALGLSRTDFAFRTRIGEERNQQC